MTTKISPLHNSEISIACDTREQKPYRFVGFKTERKTLKTADYSIVGLEDYVAIERKELGDFIGCIGRERERFEREIERLKKFSVKYIIVEAHPIEIEQSRYRGNTHPNAVFGSIYSWLAQDVPILLVGDRSRAERTVAGILWHVAKRRFEEDEAYRKIILDAREELEVEQEATKGADDEKAG